MTPRTPTSTLFPYTTLFRSHPRLFARQHVTEAGPDVAPFAGKTDFKVGLLNVWTDRKSTRLNSSHTVISYAVFCLKKKNGGELPHDVAYPVADGIARQPPRA